MNLENFIVRPHRRLVEAFAKAAAWTAITPDAAAELSREVAGLPSELPTENEEAKRFDLLALRLQLAVLHADPEFERLRDKVKEIAVLLAEKDAIPMVRDQMMLIQDVLSEEWWHDVTVPMLERMRRRLRALVQFIEKRQRRPIFTDFEDQLGEEQEVALPGFSVGTNAAKFRAKAQAFLRGHLDHVTIAKLHRNKPLTAQDLTELERMLAESGVGAPSEIKQAAEDGRGLGLFVRSLIGLDREAAKEAMAGFIAGRTLSANQLEFINLVVDHLTAHGAMPAERLYESPFTDLSPKGPEGLFTPMELGQLFAALASVEERTRIA